VPVGEPIQLAHEFIRNFIAQGNDGAQFEAGIFNIVANAWTRPVAVAGALMPRCTRGYAPDSAVFGVSKGHAFVFPGAFCGHVPRQLTDLMKPS